jgi:hypothetical protein
VRPELTEFKWKFLAKFWDDHNRAKKSFAACALSVGDLCKARLAMVRQNIVGDHVSTRLEQMGMAREHPESARFSEASRRMLELRRLSQSDL